MARECVRQRPSIGAAASYTKQHPVPFGEYIPYRSFFRRLTPAVDLVTTDMVAGADPSPIAVPIDRLGRSVPITTGICFEVAYDDLIRQSVLAGGELIVIPTNNASFGMTQESTQQLAMSQLRAIAPTDRSWNEPPCSPQTSWSPRFRCAPRRPSATSSVGGSQ